MTLDLPGLEAFVAVADLGSFLRAGARLGISQPALTRRLQRLEQIVGQELLLRRTRPIRLTPAGAALLPEAQQALSQLADAMRRAGSRNESRHVAIGCLPTLAVRYLGPLLARHRRRWQGGEVVIYDLSGAEIRTMLEEARLDFALAALGPEHWDIESIPLFEEPFFLVCPQGHRLARRARVAWGELAKEPLISIGPLSENRRIVEAALRRAKVTAHWRVEVRHLSTAVALVASGAGLTALPASAVAGSAGQSVATVPLVEPSLTRRIGLLRRRDRSLSPAARDLMEQVLKLPGTTEEAVQAAR